MEAQQHQDVMNMLREIRDDQKAFGKELSAHYVEDEHRFTSLESQNRESKQQSDRNNVISTVVGVIVALLGAFGIHVSGQGG